MMPGLDGFETCRRLKVDPKTAHIPVVMVTALDQPSDRVTGLEAGADDFLTKPIKDVALLTRVKNLVRVKRLIDELRGRASTRDAMGSLLRRQSMTRP
jgi:two-component system cell cycle response regulator